MANEELQSQAEGAVVTTSEDTFGALLKKEFKPRTEGAREEVSRAVRTLAEMVIADTPVVANDAIGTIQAIIAELDKKLSTQVNKIIHHPDFQNLESTWRGLYHLINNTETDEMLQIKVFNVSKNDLGKMLKRYKGVA